MWEINANQQNIKNVIQREVGQLFTTNPYQVTEVFLEPPMLFSGQKRYTYIKWLWISTAVVVDFQHLKVNVAD